MSQSPPALPVEKKLRLASALNMFLPGAGLFFLGRRTTGGILAGLFLGCFFAVVIIFLVGYIQYLSIALDPNLLQGNKLEEAGAAFHQSWLIGLATAGAAIYFCSTVLFSIAKIKFKAERE